MTFHQYVDSIGDSRLVVDMLVGAFQRLLLYLKQGFMVALLVPHDELAAYERLCADGFTSGLARTSNS